MIVAEPAATKVTSYPAVAFFATVAIASSLDVAETAPNTVSASVASSGVTDSVMFLTVPTAPVAVF